MTKEELLKDFEDDITDVTTAEEFLVGLAATNSKMYNKLKLLEELAELNEIILKSINKHDNHKPIQKKIDDEVGDVLSRIVMYAVSEGITEETIQQRIIDKANKFKAYIAEGIYSDI